MDVSQLSKVSKALAGALAAVVAGLLTKWLGATYTPEVNEAVRVLVDLAVTGFLGYLVVYWAPKNK